VAQYSKDTGALDPKISSRYEVMMLANNANGDIVSLSNPLPVTLGSENITITGNVNFVDTVNVASSPENPVHSHITEVGTSGLLTVNYLPIGGNVNVTNLVIVTGNVTANGTVNIGNFPATQTVNGTINIGNTVQVNVINFPVTQNVVVTNTPNVNIGTMPEVEIKNDSGNPIPISGNVTATLSGTSTVTLGAAATDAFGRLRVSNPYTLFDGGLRYFDNTYKWDQVDTGAVTSSFLPNESSILMNATGAGSAIRQTKQVFSYQPGKSLLVLLTFVMNAPTAGVTQRAGYFGAENGVYFEVAGTTKNLVIRKSTSGSVDDTTEKFAQASWNGDKLDGTGASGITLDVTKAQIFWTDIEWLGVGTVRCGFVINGQFIVCHSFHHANILNKVYMTSATLPLRYELISTGPAAAMRAICSTVMSEGGHSNRSFTRAIGTALTGKDLSNTVYRPLVCLRMKSTALDSIVVPTAFDVFGLQLAAFAYRVILNPTLTGASWTSADTDSTVEYDLSATALSGGKVITQGVFVGSNKGGSAQVTSNEIDFSQQLGRTIAGVSDIWCLAAIATTNNDDAVGIVNWQEHN
jgi:hypothetical protein